MTITEDELWSLLDSSDSAYERKHSDMRRVEQLWFKIHTAGLTNVGLQEILDRAIIYYTLLERNDTTNNTK